MITKQMRCSIFVEKETLEEHGGEEKG